MDLDTLQSWLGWMALVNIGVLMFWFAMLVLAGDFVYRLHTRWFRLPREGFDALHYGGLGLYKVGIYMFFIVPWVALLLTQSA